MKQILPLLIVCGLLSSCATILNSPQTTVEVYTTQASKIIIGKDTLQTENNRVELTLARAKDPITITSQTDSLNKTIQLKPKNSGAYWLNLLYTSFVGMLVERDNPKRFTYPKVVSIDSKNSEPTYSKFRKNYDKGETYVHFSLPHINHFNLSPPDESSRKKSLGFWGLSLGLDYYHSKNQYLNFSGNTATNLIAPIPASVKLEDGYESMSTLYFSLSNNHKINRFSFGYGIIYGENIWDLRYEDEFDPQLPPRESIRKVTENMGLIFSTYYQTGSRFNIGLVYRPTFVRLRPQSPSKYEHQISLDFAWKFRLPD